jgi:cytidylate kinase
MTTNDQSYPYSFTARFLKAQTEKAKLKIFVTANQKVLLKRRSYSDSLNLQRQLTLYKQLAKILDATELDTSYNTPDESSSIVLRLLERKCRKNER